MKRGCGKKVELETGCLNMYADNYKHKTCRQICTDINAVGCNGDTSIFKVIFFNLFKNSNNYCYLQDFSTGVVEKCRTCSDHVYGEHVQTDCAKNEAVGFACPEYADSSCFSSRFIFETNGLVESDTHHGCSTFRVTSDSKACIAVSTETGPVHGEVKQTCKETCSENECNEAITEIDNGNDGGNGGDGGVESAHFCAVCSIAVDHFNNTVGEGDKGCWGEEVAQIYWTQCAPGENYCITDMEVDWYARGDQVTTIRRSCSKEINIKVKSDS